MALLSDALMPYIERELKKTGGRWWTTTVLSQVSRSTRQRLSDAPPRGSSSLDALDMTDLLLLISGNWETFHRQLPDPARSWASELRSYRNLWAHKGAGDIDPVIVERAIDTAALLLDKIDPSAASSMRALREDKRAYTGPREELQATTRDATGTSGPKATPIAAVHLSSHIAGRRRTGSRNYWAIAPWPNDDADLFEAVWRYDKEHRTIAIRWHGIGDPAGLSREDIAERLSNGTKNEAASSRMIWDFFNKVHVGDVIVARRGRHFAVGVGIVTRTAYFDLSKGHERLSGYMSPYIGASFVDVDWKMLSTIPVSEMFTISTISNIGMQKFYRLFPGLDV